MNRSPLRPSRLRVDRGSAALIAAGVVIVALAIVLAIINTSRRRVYFEVAPWVLVLEIGLGIIAVFGLVRWRQRRSRRESLQAQQNANRLHVVAAQEDRRRFLLRLDHELKNPLTAVRIGIENLRGVTEPEPGSESDQLLKGLAGQALRLSRLTADLRKLGALEIAPLDLSEIDVPAMLAEIVSDAEDLESAGVKMELSLPRGPWPLPAVVGDRDLLQLALFNLVTNAVKFSPTGGTVEVRAHEEPGAVPAVVIEISDTGIGIPPEELETVWEELARGQAARAFPGTGMGLALVRTVITRHGGRYLLRSQPGRGTVVTVRLPARWQAVSVRPADSNSRRS